MSLLKLLNILLKYRRTKKPWKHVWNWRKEKRHMALQLNLFVRARKSVKFWFCHHATLRLNAHVAVWKSRTRYLHWQLCSRAPHSGDKVFRFRRFSSWILTALVIKVILKVKCKLKLLFFFLINCSSTLFR